MEPSLKKSDDSAPKQNGEIDEQTNLDRRQDNPGNKFSEIQPIDVKDISDTDDHLSKNEAENARVPLLSSADRRGVMPTSRNVQFSPFRKNQQSNIEATKVVFKPDTLEIPSKFASALTPRDGSKRHQQQDKKLNVPLLVVSAETGDRLCTENIEVDDTSRTDTDQNSQSEKDDKFVDNNDSNDLMTFGKVPVFHYSGNRLRRKRPTAGSRAKGQRGKASKDLNHDVLRHRKWKILYSVIPESKKTLTKVELLKSYRLHFFVTFIFIITVLSVSLSWYYKNEAQEKLYSSQAIFFNPRTRELTLSDTSKTETIRGLLARDIPLWMLPLHCPIVMGDDPHHKECLWRKIAVLRVTHFQELQVQCYNVSWESLSPKYLPHDCIYIDDANWYGPSNQSNNAFPIQGEFEYKPLNYTLDNNGLFNNVVDFYWFSSSGAAIYVDANNPIQVAWNISGSNQLCLRSNFSGSLYHKSNSLYPPVMNYTLCQGVDPLKTHKFMQSILPPMNHVQQPHTSMLQGAHWSVQSLLKTDNVNQSDVLELVSNISDQGFRNSIITLDGAWQNSHGDLYFDVKRFPNVTEMMENLTDSGCQLTLCISPYFQYMSHNFDKGVTGNMYVKDAGGAVTGLTNFQGGLAAILDVFREGGRQWYMERVQNITNLLQINSFRLTYGRHSWLPYRPHFNSEDATPNTYRKRVTELFGNLSSSSLVVEHTSDSRHVTSLIPVSTLLSSDRKCLTGAIESALTLGLMGYPFVMADGIKIGPEATQSEQQIDIKPSRELYIRWLQLASLFPAYQYSIAPWEYDPDVVSIATNLSVLRNNVVLTEMKKIELHNEIGKGFPILRPVWWLDSRNSSLHDMGIKDEFLIGNNLLVAPVLCEGVRERDVYIPPGIWENVDQKTIVVGPDIVRTNIVNIDNIIMYYKRPLAGHRQTTPEL